MHNKNKYPEIWAAMVEAEAELKPLLEKRKEFTDQIKETQKELNAFAVRTETLNKAAMQDAVRINELNEIKKRMAIAMGAKTAG